MGRKTVLVPDLGGAESVDVIELTLSNGDKISEEESILVLESDKATMDVPSPVSGSLIKYLVSEGDSVSVNDPIAEIEIQEPNTDELTDHQKVSLPKLENPKSEEISETPILDEAASIEVEKLTAENPKDNILDPNVDAEIDDLNYKNVHAGPAVRLLARDLGLDLSRVSGSGPKNRITKDDVNDFVKHHLSDQLRSQNQASISSIPQIDIPDFDKFGENDISQMTKIQKITSANMQKNWLNVPHVTQFDYADITDLEEFRDSNKTESIKRDIKLTPVAFILKAVAISLRENPDFNRSLLGDNESFTQKKYINIGMAVNTEKGLVVPVLKSVDEMGVWDLASSIAVMAAKARNGKLLPSDMQGGCFTVSSLGAIGGHGFTPIVNSPELGILGVSKSQIMPIWNGSEFEPRMMLPLSLSYDHRLINGGAAGKFLCNVVHLLSDLRAMIL